MRFFQGDVLMMLIAFACVLVMTLWHFIYGTLVYLCSVDEVGDVDVLMQKTTEALFHYNSVMFLLSLCYIGGILFQFWGMNRPLFVFLGLWYIGAGCVNFYYATRPGVGILQMLQWILFLATGLILLIL